MIEKMEFLRITGPKEDIDRVNEKYLMKYDIHLENAISELSDVPNIKPFVEVNPHKESLTKAESLIHMLGTCEDEIPKIELDDAVEIVNHAYDLVDEITLQKESLINQKKHLEKLLEEIEPFRLLDYELHKILDFEFIRFRFGRIAHEYFQKFSKYGYENLNTVFYECDRDDSYVWGVYFVPASTSTKVDAVYSSLHFERLYIADEYEGTPEQAYQKLLLDIDEVSKQMDALDDKVKETLENSRTKVFGAYEKLTTYSENFSIRKMAACTKKQSKGSVFYILCGWMRKKDAGSFLQEIENDPKVFCLSDDGTEALEAIPPTNLKNPKIFKPFEMFIQMYGLPAYTEMDPTLFVALTYTLIFGIMFGDVGQGALLVIGGAIMYKIKKMNIAGIISIAGIWSVIFGFMYGSVFGDEELLSPVWRRPMDDIMSTLMVSICFGIILILVAMVLHIINAIKEKDIEALLFDPSGVAGLLVYGTAVVAILLVFTGHTMPGTIILAVLIGVPLICIILKEPLGRILKKKRALEQGQSVGMFLIEALVEGFDVVLSYATNTISFVRVGAFALSHAGMMGVVFTLAGAEQGNPNMLVIILGNIVVIGLEGLVVGIQVLRLEYYEMFSRFYKGSGKEFKPFRKNKANNI